MTIGIIDTGIITTQTITELIISDTIEQPTTPAGGAITETDLADLWDDNLTDIWEQDL